MVNGFWMMNIAISKSFSEHFSLQGGTENLFNYINPAKLSNIAGRLFFLNLNYSLVNKPHNHKNDKQWFYWTGKDRENGSNGPGLKK